jgi:hypothetical protein
MLRFESTGEVACRHLIQHISAMGAALGMLGGQGGPGYLSESLQGLVLFAAPPAGTVCS